MSGYFTELALSIDAMLGDAAPAVEAGITDELSEAEETRRRAYATTVAAWSSPVATLGSDNAPATRSRGRAAGMGKGSAKPSSTQRPAVAAQAKKAAPRAVKFASTGISTPSAPAAPLEAAAVVSGNGYHRDAGGVVQPPPSALSSCTVAICRWPWRRAASIFVARRVRWDSMTSR